LTQLNNITALVQGVKKKEVKAMRSLYQQFSKGMLATSYRITNDLQESEDVLQEAFLSSFQKIDQLKESARYGDWLKRIVVNKSLVVVKKRIRFEEVETVFNQVEQEEELWYKGISFREIEKAIQQLPEGCRQVFSLFLLDNYKHQEISEMLQISVSTSKSQYRYALKLMRQKLKR